MVVGECIVILHEGSRNDDPSISSVISPTWFSVVLNSFKMH